MQVNNEYWNAVFFFLLEYGSTGEIASNIVRKQILDGRIDDKLEMAATNSDFLHAELYDLRHLTPSTPSIQHSE